MTYCSYSPNGPFILKPPPEEKKRAEQSFSFKLSVKRHWGTKWGFCKLMGSNLLAAQRAGTKGRRGEEKERARNKEKRI